MLQDCSGPQDEDDWWHAMYYDFLKQLYDTDNLKEKVKRENKKRQGKKFVR